jgi:hypothetical protein
MYMALNMKNSKWAGLVLSLLILVVLSGCERDMRIKIDGKNPPTFALSGSGNLVFLSLGEVQDNKPPPLGAPDLWKIRPNDNNKISQLPSITYGIVPNGFIQVVPASGTPPPLIEGKVYEFGGPADSANGGSIWFTIQGGKSVEVPTPGDSP